jgi:hypothetical protein
MGGLVGGFGVFVVSCRLNCCLNLYIREGEVAVSKRSKLAVAKAACGNCHNQKTKACTSQPQLATKNSNPEMLLCHSSHSTTTNRKKTKTPAKLTWLTAKTA